MSSISQEICQKVTSWEMEKNGYCTCGLVFLISLLALALISNICRISSDSEGLRIVAFSSLICSPFPLWALGRRFLQKYKFHKEQKFFFEHYQKIENDLKDIVQLFEQAKSYNSSVEKANIQNLIAERIQEREKQMWTKLNALRVKQKQLWRLDSDTWESRKEQHKMKVMAWEIRGGLRRGPRPELRRIELSEEDQTTLDTHAQFFKEHQLLIPHLKATIFQKITS